MTATPATRVSIRGIRSVPVTFFDIRGNEAFFAKLDRIFNPLNEEDRLFTRTKQSETCVRFTQNGEAYPTCDFVLHLAFLIARDYDSIAEATKDLPALSAKMVGLYDDREIHTGTVERTDRIGKILHSLATAQYAMAV